MVISSIDLKGGEVVQLKNGKDLVLKREDPLSLIKEFDRYGKVAVVDLDAAMGEGDNLDLMKSLLRKGDVRCGGGIRTTKRAKELVSLGAQKVIVGSTAWEGDPASSYLNKDFLSELVAAIGKERVIIALDARDGKVAINGWKKTLDLNYLDAAVLAEKYSSELLFTCVEREGCLKGGPLEEAKKLRERVSSSLTIAGGVSTIDEIVALEDLCCDVQLGMALYTGAVDLGEAFVSCLNWKKVGDLIPVIAEDAAGEVLMMGYANREAFKKTQDLGQLTFFSRTRKKLWTKGETSGHFLYVEKLRADCDRDTVLATVRPAGPVCHRGTYTCWTDRVIPRSTWERLADTISERIKSGDSASYTASLSQERVREKLMEEAGELVEANGREDLIWEAADVLYFLTVLITKEGLTIQDVLDELDRRHK